MVVCCCVCNRNTGRNPSLTFHSFPKNESLREKWCARMELNSKDLGRFPRICSLHFEQKLIPGKNDRSRLKKNALPSILIPKDDEKEHEEFKKNTLKMEPQSSEIDEDEDEDEKETGADQMVKREKLFEVLLKEENIDTEDEGTSAECVQPKKKVTRRKRLTLQALCNSQQLTFADRLQRIKRIRWGRIARSPKLAEACFDEAIDIIKYFEKKLAYKDI